MNLKQLRAAEAVAQATLDGMALSSHFEIPNFRAPEDASDPNDDYDWGKVFQPCAPPPLPSYLEVNPDDVTLIKTLTRKFERDMPCATFKADISGIGICVMKVFRQSMETPHWRSFDHEIQAYAKFNQAKLSDALVVPRCLGWTYLNAKDWAAFHPSPWFVRCRDERKPLRAVIIEYFPNATQLTLRHTTLHIVAQARQRLRLIHESGVIWRDPEPRNILVLPHNHIVFVDFETALSLPWASRLSEQDFRHDRDDLFHALYWKALPWKWHLLRRSWEISPEAQAEIKDIENTLQPLGGEFYG